MHIPALNWCFSAPPSSNICTSSRWLQNMKFRHQQLSHVTYTEDCIKHRAAFICMHPRLCWVVHWMQGAVACHSGLCISSQRLADVLEMKHVQGCWPAKAKRGNKGESKREEQGVWVWWQSGSPAKTAWFPERLYGGAKTTTGMTRYDQFHLALSFCFSLTLPILLPPSAPGSSFLHPPG